jgi:hypothetical protein
MKRSTTPLSVILSEVVFLFGDILISGDNTAFSLISGRRIKRPATGVSYAKSNQTTSTFLAKPREKIDFKRTH